MLICVVSMNLVSDFFYAITKHKLPLGCSATRLPESNRRDRLCVVASMPQLGILMAGFVGSKLPTGDLTIIVNPVALDRSSTSNYILNSELE